MKNLWIIANWKANKTLPEALVWVDSVGPKLHLNDDIKVVVCPDFLALEEVGKKIKVGNFPILVGAQDLSPFTEGPYTGEEPARALSGFVSVAILGHSERRQGFGETDKMVAEKTDQALKYGIFPLVCVQDKTTPVPEGAKLVAYEPVFAIGSGNPDTPENAESVAKAIKEKNPKPEVLYGGSVTSQNCKAYIKQDNISGLLIGTASLDPEEFLKIVEECAHG